MVTKEVMQANDEVILTSFPDNRSPGRAFRGFIHLEEGT